MNFHSQQKLIPSSPFRFIIHILKSRYLLLISIVFLTLLTEVIFALTPVLIGRIIDTASNYTMDHDDIISNVGKLVALYVLLRFSAVMLIRSSSVALHYASKYIRSSVIRILFAHLSLHSASYFSNRFSGSISSDVSIVAQNSVRMLNFFVLRNIF